jgi:hypothetical protein
MPVPQNGFQIAREQLLEHAADYAEKRGSPRRRMLKQGRVILSDSTTITCVIRDMSETGARIVFGGPVSLPPAFRLAIVHSDDVYAVELVWHRGFAAGVAIKR